MGFFFEESTIEEAAAKPRRAVAKAPGAKAQRKVIAAGAKGCDACALKGSWGSLSSPRMPMKGPKDATVLILGGAPTREADFKGEPFFGSTFKLIMDPIPGRERDTLAFQNVARCMSLKEGDPEDHTMHACSDYLAEEIAERPIKFIIGVGAGPLRRFWPGAQISRVHGVPIPVYIGGKSVWYFPIMDPYMVEERNKGSYRSPMMSAFLADIKRFFRDRKTWGKPFIATPKASDVVIPETYEQARDLIGKMRGVLGFDVETKKLKPVEIGSRLLSAGFSDCDITIAFPIDHPEKQTDWGLRLTLETLRSRPWVGHNAGFELIWLKHFGGDTEEEFARAEDSQAMCRILCERETIANLKTCSMVAFGVDIKGITGVNAKAILEYPLSEMLPYNGLDAYASAQIDRVMGDKARRDPNYQRMVDSIQTTSVMELKGLPVDLETAVELKATWEAKVAAAQKKAEKQYEVRQFELSRQKQFRLSANEDIGFALVEYGRLKLPKNNKPGTYKTDDASLTEATKEEPNQLVEAVLEHRHASKFVSTYIDPILEVPERYTDGMLHPSYTVLLTRTARLSSTDPNIQNFPKRDAEGRKLRRAVVPPPGYILVAIDYGQLEWRIAAMASQDRLMIESILSGVDVHADWRDRILKREPDYWFRMAEMSGSDPNDEKATLKGGRGLIKTDFVFASVFGSSADSCSKRTGIALPKMMDIQGEFWTMFPDVKKWHKKQRREYDDLGQTRTLTERVRRGVLSGNEPINTPIQGTAADIVTESMNEMRKIAHDLKEPCLCPRINIHDDLTFFLPDTNDDDLMGYIDIIAETLTKVRHPWQIVPLTVEVSVGYNWADLDEIHVYTGDYVR